MSGTDTIWIRFLDESIGGGISGAFAIGPDIEAAVVAQLRAANITNVGQRAYAKVPADAVFPLITVARIGGVPPVRPYLDAGNIQVDIWGDTKDRTLDIAQAARAACLEMEGQSYLVGTRGLFVTGTSDALGLTWLPDEETGRARYLFSVIVFAHSL